jgi:hypothetical protein
MDDGLIFQRVRALRALQAAATEAVAAWNNPGTGDGRLYDAMAALERTLRGNTSDAPTMPHIHPWPDEATLNQWEREGNEKFSG